MKKASNASVSNVNPRWVKTAPRGYERDHPRAELLRHKSLTASAQHGTPDWLDTPEAIDVVAHDWRAFRPLMDWLRDHVA